MFKHTPVGRKVNKLDSIRGGSSATNADVKPVFSGKTSPNTHDSIQGGSSVTNFDIKPMFEVPAGGVETSRINRGNAYIEPVNVESGSSTNDRSK